MMYSVRTRLGGQHRHVDSTCLPFYGSGCGDMQYRPSPEPYTKVPSPWPVPAVEAVLSVYDECVSATIVSTSLEADIAAARTVQKAREFDSRHATTLKDKELELSARAPPRSWSIEEECPCIVSHSDRKRKDPVPISSPLERLTNVMRSWIMGIRAYFPLELPVTHADLAPWYAMPKEAPARCGGDENEGARLVDTVLKRTAKDYQAS
ncbi:uncharacterized protein CCOS01_08585 [Colletotrichum costaricense]|uniref:Uncharacterized protein n=2 Tax=Colletotrichum acutatum species complex TaxID=2707335 RepID=A0AAJ0E0X3_9PEZI|nr:uncharacterized protein CCOS01_08585 [Colletotrichum costaricense]KAI3528095.1 hypothetical protein CSPX01_16461 [Colletotrichum filicis]KAK1526167.1 hypothetical protein CCOS01_08585 [Colletotrichum costaricense]